MRVGWALLEGRDRIALVPPGGIGVGAQGDAWPPGIGHVSLRQQSATVSNPESSPNNGTSSADPRRPSLRGYPAGAFYLQHQSPGTLWLFLQRLLARAHARAQAQATLLTSSPADSSKPASSPIIFSQAKFGNISLRSTG